MKMLPATISDIYQAFLDFGCSVVSKTMNSFSSMGLDQKHEQQNQDVKKDDVFLGLTENKEKLMCRMVCGLEVRRVVSVSEAECVLIKEGKTEFCHPTKLLSFKSCSYVMSIV